MSTPAQKSELNQNELDRILEYIRGVEKIEKPIPTLAKEVILKKFGWPSDGPASRGYKRTRAALQKLENQGEIECVWSSGKRLICVRRKKVGSPLPPPETVETGSAAIKVTAMETNDDGVQQKRTQDRVLAFRHLKPKGQAKRDAEIIRRGERHEDWLHTTTLKLIDVLTREFPQLILSGSSSRSGRHNPNKGRIDLQDHWGEDICLRLTTRHPNGPIISGSIIYDAKGARSDVKEFNTNIIRHPGQNGALLKKAIWANVIYRSRKNLTEEILNDLINVGLLPSDFDKEKIFNYFED